MCAVPHLLLRCTRPREGSAPVWFLIPSVYGGRESERSTFKRMGARITGLNPRPRARGAEHRILAGGSCLCRAAVMASLRNAHPLSGRHSYIGQRSAVSSNTSRGTGEGCGVGILYLKSCDNVITRRGICRRSVSRIRTQTARSRHRPVGSCYAGPCTEGGGSARPRWSAWSPSCSVRCLRVGRSDGEQREGRQDDRCALAGGD
jgi:hypothetical protein